MDTDLSTAEKNDLAELVAQLMNWRKLNHMAVESKKGNFVGLISLNQLTAALQKNSAAKKPKDLLVKHIMESNPKTIGPEDSIKDALQIMVDNEISCLPVILRNELVGILSQNQLIGIDKNGDV